MNNIELNKKLDEIFEDFEQNGTAQTVAERNETLIEMISGTYDQLL